MGLVIIFNKIFCASTREWSMERNEEVGQSQTLWLHALYAVDFNIWMISIQKVLRTFGKKKSTKRKNIIHVVVNWREMMNILWSSILTVFTNFNVPYWKIIHKNSTILAVNSKVICQVIKFNRLLDGPFFFSCIVILYKIQILLNLT